MSKSQGGPFTPAESAMARQNILYVYLNFCLAKCTLEDAFEHWLYGEAPADVTPADLDAKWLELKTRFQPWDNDYASEVEKMTGWQRNTFSLFRYPLYMITYSMATVGGCQVAHLAETNLVGTIQRYKQALTLGNTQPLSMLFQTVGLSFPFSEWAVDEAVQFIFRRARENL